MLYIVSHLSNLCLVPMGYWEDGALMLTYADDNADKSMLIDSDIDLVLSAHVIILPRVAEGREEPSHQG